MKTIEIVFTRSKLKCPLGSWLIQWYTKKPYSHVSRRLQVQDWGAAYYQANDGKVNYETEEEFLKKHHIVAKYTIPVEDAVDHEVRKICWQNVGKPYGLPQNLGMVYVDLCAKLGITVCNPWPRGVNCSELVYCMVLKPAFPDLDLCPNEVKPQHIEEIIKTRVKDYTVEYFD